MAFFDIELKLRKDPLFRQQMEGVLQRYAKATQEAELNETKLPAVKDQLDKILHLCQYNPVNFIPHYFPTYPRQEPLSYRDYPQMVPMFTPNVGGYLAIRGSRGISKTTSIAARQLVFSQWFTGFRSLYICPRTDHLKTYADKLKEMEQAFLLFRRHSNFRNNLYYKEYPNTSIIKLIYVLTSASKARGNHVDEIVFDEFQDFDYGLFPEISEIQQASPMPMTIFAGTSLTTNSSLEYVYSKSTRSVWKMVCPACNFENWPDLDCKHGDKDVLDMISPTGPVCIKCNAKLDVTDASWMHRSDNGLRENQIGLHVPQIIVPSVVNNPNRWNDIYKKKMAGDRNKFLQEKLGIPTEEGTREISQDQLEAICVLGDKLEVLYSQAKAGRYYRMITSGMDWGGSDHNPGTKSKASYTVHSVIGIPWENKHFDILYMNKYSGMDYESILQNILAKHKELGGRFIGSDDGGGQFYNERIRNISNPLQHFIFKYGGPYPNLVAPKKETSRINDYILDRTDSISRLYAMIKTGQLRCYAWRFASEYLMDFLQLHRHIDESSTTGAKSFRYHKNPAHPDDTLHSVNYAVMAARIALGEPLFADKSVQDAVNRSIAGSGGLSARQGVPMRNVAMSH